MTSVAVSFLLSLFFTWLVLRTLQPKASAHASLVAVPGGSPIPTAGGLGMVVATTVVGVWLGWEAQSGLLSLVVIALPLAAIGWVDDRKGLGIGIRLLVQVAVCAAGLLLVPYSPLHSLDVGAAGWILVSAVLLFAAVWWVNLFNFMDGLDGLAGSQAMFMLAAAMLLAYLRSPAVVGEPSWQLMLATTASVLAFLIFNWAPARIYMGDTGSTWLGFVIFSVALLTAHERWVEAVEWLILGASFIVDATVTLITRMVRRELWYVGHQTHAYQRLCSHWSGDSQAHRQVTLGVMGINVLWLLPIAALCGYYPQQKFICLAAAYVPLIIAAVALGAGRPR